MVVYNGRRRLCLAMPACPSRAFVLESVAWAGGGALVIAVCFAGGIEDAGAV